MSSRQEVRAQLDKNLDDAAWRAEHPGVDRDLDQWGATSEAQAEMDRVMLL